MSDLAVGAQHDDDGGMSRGALWVLFLSALPPFECVGFEPPMDTPLVVVSNNKANHRALPLKATIFDPFGFVATDADVTLRPVVQVIFSSVPSSDPVDVTADALPVGKVSKGNIFSYDSGSELWQYNLDTENYDAPGTYTVTMVSGDKSE